MGKGAPLRWVENKLLARHLSGRGIEIGALWRKFPVPRNVLVFYVDRTAPEHLRRQYSEIKSPLVPPDLVADAMRLPFCSGSLDFVIASHVLEHLPFPLAALRQWYQVLRPGGVLLLKIPDKRYTFDLRRQRTPLQHLIAEDRAPGTFDKRAHFEDWVENVSGRPRTTSEFAVDVKNLLEADCSIHYHVWIDQDIRELVEFTRSEFHYDWQPVVFWNAHFYRKECVVMLQRAG
jgi:SAM-dependent methyltransferase